MPPPPCFTVGVLMMREFASDRCLVSPDLPNSRVCLFLLEVESFSCCSSVKLWGASSGPTSSRTSGRRSSHGRFSSVEASFCFLLMDLTLLCGTLWVQHDFLTQPWSARLHSFVENLFSSPFGLFWVEAHTPAGVFLMNCCFLSNTCITPGWTATKSEKWPSRCMWLQYFCKYCSFWASEVCTITPVTHLSESCVSQSESGASSCFVLQLCPRCWREPFEAFKSCIFGSRECK